MSGIQLSEAQIKQVFDEAKEQADYLIGIYKLVFPEWDEIDSIDGYPSCNSNTWTHICDLAMEFDKRCHPNVMAGGAWMNQGFSSNNELDDWTVSRDSCSVKYHTR